MGFVGPGSGEGSGAGPALTAAVLAQVVVAARIGGIIAFGEVARPCAAAQHPDRIVDRDLALGAFRRHRRFAVIDVLVGILLAAPAGASRSGPAAGTDS
jgi:hypothetical protein